MTSQGHPACGRARARILLAALAVAFAAAPRAWPQAAVTRELAVGFASTPAYESQRDWKEKVTRRLAYASKIFETQFRLRFEPAAFWPWPVEEREQELNFLLEDLRSRFPLGEVDVVIGLARLQDTASQGELQDLHALGRSRPFSGYLVLRTPPEKLLKIQEETVLAHELGHLFGAVHTSDLASIMSPVVDRQIPSTFDAANREIVLQTRDVDFSRGTRDFGERAVHILLGSYLKLMNYDQSFEFYWGLGHFYAQLGQLEDAVRVWKAAVPLDAENARVRYDLGTAYFKLGKLADASRELSAAVSKFGHASEETDKAEALKMLGAVYFKQENYLAAHHAWNRAAAILPKDFDLEVNLIAVKLRRGQVDDAIRDFTRVLKQDPKSAKILSNLGFAYYQKGDYPNAATYLKRALGAVGDQTVSGTVTVLDTAQPSEIHTRLGHVYLSMGDPAQARVHFDEACRVNPSIECRQTLGRLAYETGDWDGAVAQLSGVLLERRDDPDVYGLLGVALAKKGEVEKALTIFQEGLTHTQNDEAAARLHANIGNLYLQGEKADLALKEFQRAIDKAWEFPEGHFGLALAYLGLSRPLDAQQALRTVLQIQPTHQQARALLARIEQALKEEQQQKQQQQAQQGAAVELHGTVIEQG